MPMRVTAITHRRNPIIPSYISQVAPSESSVIKRVAYEPLFLAHLRNTLGIRGVKTRRAARAADRAAARHGDHGREGHAAHRDLARALRRRLVQGRLRQDLHRGQRGHRSRQRGRAAVGDGLSHESGRGRADCCRIAARATGRSASTTRKRTSTLLMDATMKGDMPPLALPKQEYMERAKAIWQELGLGRAAPAAAVVRLFAGRLAAAMGRGRQARGARPLSRKRQDQRKAAAQGPQARDEVSAGQRRQRQGLSFKACKRPPPPAERGSVVSGRSGVR